MARWVKSNGDRARVRSRQLVWATVHACLFGLVAVLLALS
jgi:hypothetical protein